MYAVGRLGSYISRGVYTVSGPFHPFGGAVDIIVVQQEDGSFKSSAWNVRFGKFQGVLKSKEKVVNICVNGEDASFHMYLDNKGEAYFLREVDAKEGESVLFPSTSSSDETDEQSQEKRQPVKSKSCKYDAESLIVDHNNKCNGKVLSRTNSRKSRIFGIFGNRSMKERMTVNEEAEGDNSTIRRVDSLERAEFAANLMEVKWSTSLATKKNRKEGDSRLSCPDILESGVDEDMQISSEHRRVCSSLPDCALQEATAFCNAQIGNDSLSGFDKTPSYAEEASLISCLNTPNIVSRVCRELDESGATENDGNVKALISNITGSDPTIPHSLEVEAFPFPGKHFVGRVFDDKGVVLAGCGISEKDGGIDRVESFIYCQSSESAVVGTDVSSEQTHGKLYIARGDCGKLHVHAEAVHARTELLSKDAVTEQFVEDIALKVQPLEAPETYSHKTAHHSCTGNHNGEPGGPAKAPEHCSQMVPINALPDSVEIESRIVSRLSNSDHQVQDEKEFKGEDIACDVQTSSGYISGSEITEATSVVPPGRLEEEQFLFSDSDELNTTKVQCTESSSSQCVDGEISVLCSPDGSKEFNGSAVSTNYESYSSPEKFAQEIPSTGFQKVIGKLKATSTTVDIPRNQKAADKEVGMLVGSLPSMWHQTDNLSALDLDAPLSHSLDSKAKTLKWIQQNRDDLSCIKLDIEQQLPLVKLDAENAEGTEELKDVPGSPALGDPSKASVTPSGSWKLWPFRFRRTNSQKAMQPNLNDCGSPEVENASESAVGVDSSNIVLTPKGMKKTERATSPTSEQLASLNLNEGRNTVTFTFSTAMLGKQQVDARIYLWKWNTRIVISDVDGTITKSDVLGQFMPLVGVDWSQTGVTHLFSAIKENGYELLFLSARAISQSSQTRQFLFNLKQDGKALPDGPVVISPDGLFPSLFREVIRRAPHEFKIACLEDIKSLFPSDCNPFYAGFGNRDTDEFSYLKVGIPLGKIFIINPKGEIVVNRRVDAKTYTSLHALVNGMFPPTTSSHEQEDFNSWNFWKLPPPDVS
ncbi:phosphatidate phosphatase PAH2 isoform X1 [Rosa rugosa]|uniref:phosphatidate phosphatase PAH2 isoform X1 n=1 Tax=Rosa rugosa TaxID=74645 RepID=UPI002B404994|nr:phosphatidate phosphatase PAH2 isoform X1 [Rosa rugosa]XP_062018872.1 phosphatidate phosphatase PAH2 isoform X1 [Rosa rugosa]